METPLTKHINPNKNHLDLKEYVQAGGYEGLRKALKTSPDEIINLVKTSNLLGRGGAGFSTGLKWSFVPKNIEPRYLIANGDEMEPGAFKDKYLIEGNPHQLIEGMIISAYAIQCNTAFIFIRWAYKKAAMILKHAIAEAYNAGFLGNNILGTGFNLDIHVHTSAGRYICGEESALINSMQGRRANPRAKPPFSVLSGLYGKPTIVNNIETLSWISHIINNGADWFKGLSITGEGGTKIYGASGRVKNPGLWELPLGTTMGEIINEHAGGMAEGYKFKGALPGGASTEFLLEKHFNTKMDFSSVPKSGSRLGTGTFIVLDDKTCPIKFVHNLIKFFADESCGWCTPCREGLPWVEKILSAFEKGEAKIEYIDILKHHTKYLWLGNTFCAHAPGAMEPLKSSIEYFYDEYINHINNKGCSYK